MLSRGGYLLVLIVVLMSLGGSRAAGLPERVANTSIRLPNDLHPSTFENVEAFPGMQFDSVVAFASPPGETDRLFVVEKEGRIVVITNLAAPTRTIFLDLTSQVDSGGEAGLLGLAFHPNFRNNRQFYVFYTLQTSSQDLNGAFHFGLHDRVSRFEASSYDPNQADASSEQLLISQFDRASNHNGGDLHFGPDGYLYVSLGDEGGAGDDFGNSQQIDRNFFSGILRLDVDQRPGSLPPNPHGAVSPNYAVPPDNPFVGVSSFNGVGIDPDRVRTEFWAVGLRNPWRFSFDSWTGDLLCGDVGQGSREEVNLIRRGGNYGWNFLEGSIPYAGFPWAFNNVKPIAEYERPGFSLELDRQGICVIGGVVYRGSRMPELNGRYIFGDWGTGFIWALQHDGTQATEFRTLLSGSGMNCFGTDPSNGDILVASWTVLRLVPVRTPQEPPATLADTGIFADVASLTPAPGVLPYGVNVPFWSDHAHKQRWFSIPNPDQRMTFRPDASWSFPTGSVWIKHFDLEMIRGVPESSRRIETRVLVKTSDGVYGVTYRWGESTDNALLVPSAGMDEEFEIQDNGVARRQTWHYPGRSECLTCHTPAGGYVLGFTAAQLNCDYNFTEGATNQLQALEDTGYFTTRIPNPETLSRLSDAADASATIEHRVRSYLAANCAQCHQPGGTALGQWDARIHVPTAHAGLIDGGLNDSGGNPRARVVVPGSLEDSMLLTRISHRGPGRMPPLGSSVVDTEDVSLLSDWITNVLVQPPGEPIALEIRGLGSIQGLTNGQRLEVGKYYTVTATAAAGQLFTHWTGTLISSANPLRFQMQPGMTLAANFVANRYLGLQGTYLGLIQAPAGLPPAVSGWVTAAIGSSGGYSARLELAGRRISLSGRFSESGASTNQISDKVLGPVRVELALAVANSLDLTGRVFAPNWTADLTGVRPYPRNPISFTWATDDSADAVVSGGESFGVIKVNADGRATIQGVLATGGSFSRGTVLSADGRLPVFVNVGRLYSALGWARVATGERVLSGSLTWNSLQPDGSRRHGDVPVIGSVHTKTYSLPPGTRVNVVCIAGGLPTVVSNSVVVDAARLRWSSETPPVMSIRMNWESGLFSGVFAGPVNSRAQLFRGALLQQQGYGTGYFSGTNQTGRVQVRF